MAKIAILNDNMINMIAAGEVIERPASVVKEFVENSIDAGASRIALSIEDGGRKLISVTDNGTGIDAEDITAAFQPHATSKIQCVSDLNEIKTLGFRGEALASIAAVSTVKLTSRTPESIQANTIEIDCGQTQPVKPCSGDYGTTIESRNLFYKLPARRKFLRTANTEMSHITEHFTRIALAYCHIDMTLTHNDRLIHHLTASQTLNERIAQLLSKDLAEDLIEAQSHEKNINIHALLGKPSRARANSKFQYVFLNNRCIRDKFIAHAIKEAYRGLIEPNKYPMAFLFLEMPTEAFDVNVHPTKSEVRFENANLVHSQVLAVLREKLLSADLDVAAKLPSYTPPASTQFVPVDQQQRRQRITNAMSDFFKTHAPNARSQQSFTFPKAAKHAAGTADAPVASRAETPPATPPETGHAAFTGQRFLQLHNSYIVTETDEGFVIIDQHALHERIIYETLCRRIASDRLESQRLLIPETFTLTDAQNDAIKTHADLIEKLGIELEPFGPQTIAIQAFPSILEKANPLQFVRDMLDMMIENAADLDEERLLHEILDMTACKAAIKAGQPLTDQEMARLLADKDTVERTSRCPHGRPTTLKFSMGDLEKQFKRTGF